MWDNVLIKQGYEKCAFEFKRLMEESPENAHLILSGPLLKLREQIELSPSGFQNSIESIYSKELEKIKEAIRTKRFVQCSKALVILRRAIPEMPMILISSILSIYYGSLETSRMYLRSKLFSNAMELLITKGKERNINGNNLFLKWVSLEIVSTFVSIAKERSRHIGKKKFVQSLKHDLFSNLLNQDIEFFEKNDLYEYRHLIGNCDYVCTSLLNYPTTILESISSNITSLHYLFFKLNFKVSFVSMFFLFPFKLFLHNQLDQAGKRFETNSLFTSGKSFVDIWQTIVDPRGLKTLKAFAKEVQESKEFDRKVKNKDELDERVSFIESVTQPLKDLTNHLVEIVLFWYSNGKIQDIASYLQVSQFTFERLQFLYYSLQLFQEDVLEPIEKMHDLLSCEPKVNMKQPALPPTADGFQKLDYLQ